MDLKHLKNFMVIVEEDVNMSKAAKRLHISQPPLSQQMKIIEETLGIELFERRGKKLDLTSHGKILYERAKKIVNLYDEMKTEMTEMGRGVKGKITIAVSIFYSAIFQSSILFERIKQFCRDYPNVKLKIVHTDGNQLFTRMDAREIDLVIINLPVDEGVFEYIPLEKQDFVFIMPASWQLNLPSYEIPFRQIEHLPLMLLKRDTGYGLYEKVLEHCERHHFTPNLVVESNNILTIIAMVDAGIGATILPQSVLKQFPNQNLKAYHFSDTKFYSESILMWLKDRYLTEATQLFLNYFEAPNIGEELNQLKKSMRVGDL